MSQDREQDPAPLLSVGPGQIQFADACHPPLNAGEYRVGMRQTIKESADSAVPWNSDPYLSDFGFRVDAPRFVLKGADIHCVYPPANAIGRYDNALPHVVLNRRTLPWERTLDGATPGLGKPYPPWMALLLLEEDELAVCDQHGHPTGKRRDVRSLPVLPRNGGDDSLLFPSERDAVCAPDLGQGQEAWKLEALRWATASCLAIDLPAGLFRSVAPRIDELPYLAHVRQVDTGNKEVLGINDRGWFSLVVGNRVPRSNTAYRVLLVSLEGWKPWLDAEANWQPPARRDLVRLAVLGSWGFVCAGSNDFKVYMTALNQDRNQADKCTGATDAWLGLPFDAYDEDENANHKDPDTLVNGAYARGHTALDHLMRQGEKTVSWFRGPLVPLNYAKPVQIGELVGCADELLRYDPDWGLFDTGFAAAWQMGRLLALQNQGFAMALDRVRRRLRRIAEDSMRGHEAELDRRRIGLELKDTIEDGLLAFLASEAGRSAVTGTAKSGGAEPTPISDGDGGQDEGVDFNAAAACAANEAAERDLAQVTGWLGRLVLLYGVPFQYLVAQEEMLPAQSIRFFFLDPIWVQCLVQGACSVGRTGYADGIVDQAMNQILVPSGSNASTSASATTDHPPATSVDASASATAAASVRASLRQEREGITPPEGAASLNWPLTGFLLRSPLVSGWRGLEVLAFRDVRDDERHHWEQDGALDADARERYETCNVVPLAPLRIEQLGDDILIAIFNGVVAQAVVRQPQEGLHFGVTRGQLGDDWTWTKHLRDPATGATLNGCEIDGLMRAVANSGPAGIVDVVGLAERMQTKLKECAHPAEHFGSAAFALQMIESPLEVIFRAQYPGGS